MNIQTSNKYLLNSFMITFELLLGFFFFFAITDNADMNIVTHLLVHTSLHIPQRRLLVIET